MKVLFTLFLVLSYSLSSAQIYSDSLSHISHDKLKDTSILSEVLLNARVTNDLESSPSQINEKLRSDFEKEFILAQNWSKKLILSLSIIFSLAIFVVWYYFKQREKQILLEQDKLLNEIESLKKKLVVQSVSSSINDKKQLSLDKDKLEKAIDSKIGESSWMILNLIFENPSISNKELAKEVSLSLEGVSSSLRRMYQTFDIPATSNKKITLIMKATRLSFDN